MPERSEDTLPHARITAGVWLAFDDTDGPDGGCTTSLVRPLLAALSGGALAGPPRLVRLWPSNPWKTRGNAAVVLPLHDIVAPDDVLDVARRVIARQARLAPGKGAGVAVFDEPPDASWYWRGVQGPVALEDASAALTAVPHATLGSGRGLIGALCAAAWRPDEHATWEHIAYRESARVGRPRDVDASSLAMVERAYPEMFDCVDLRTGRAVMVPRTPCPVLYGLRATQPGRLAVAAERIASEPVAWTTTFVTNHASDDHVTDTCLAPLIVTARPRALRGGHVRLDGRTSDGEARTCMAFEPTGTLRHAVLRVREGDVVLPVGSLREHTVNLEKLLHMPTTRRAAMPCRACGSAMRSTGRAGPRKCRCCGARSPSAAEQDPAAWYEADASARRHLARPLRLGLAPRVSAAAQAQPIPLASGLDESATTPTTTRARKQ